MTLKKPRIILISGVISLTVLITCIVWTKLPSGNSQQQVDTVIELPTQTVEEVLASPSLRVARYIRDTSNHGKNEKAPSNNHRTRGGKTETHAPHTVPDAQGVATPNAHHDEAEHQQDIEQFQEIERHFQENMAFYTQMLNDLGADAIRVNEQIRADLSAMSPDEILEAASDLKAFYSQYGLDTSALD